MRIVNRLEEGAQTPGTQTGKEQAWEGKASTNAPRRKAAILFPLAPARCGQAARDTVHSREGAARA